MCRSQSSYLIDFLISGKLLSRSVLRCLQKWQELTTGQITVPNPCELHMCSIFGLYLFFPHVKVLPAGQKSPARLLGVRAVSLAGGRGH